LPQIGTHLLVLVCRVPWHDPAPLSLCNQNTNRSRYISGHKSCGQKNPEKQRLDGVTVLRQAPARTSGRGGTEESVRPKGNLVGNQTLLVPHPWGIPRGQKGGMPVHCMHMHMQRISQGRKHNQNHSAPVYNREIKKNNRGCFQLNPFT
jgi:hypothetical protein